MDDGLQLELDYVMTSFVPRRRFAPTPTPSSNTRLILFHCSPACLPLLGVVGQMTRHCSNLASAVHKTLCRRRLHCQAQFIDGARLLATHLPRMPHDIQSLTILASSPQRLQFCYTQFYSAASLTAARSPLSLHCSNCIIQYYALPTFNTLLLKPHALPTSIDGLLRVLFFSLDLFIGCHMELHDRRRA
jgi:hypothetical protein